MKKRPRVALLVETSNSYARGLLRGIHAYVEEQNSWTTYLFEQGRGDAPPTWLNENWRGDGILARIENRHIAQVVARTGLPVVDVSSSKLAPEFPSVSTKGSAVARLTAEHLAERGLVHFAFCGDDRFPWSKTRSEEFANCVAELGNVCDVYRPQKGTKSPTNWDEEERDLIRWLRKLPKPVGVMSCHDIRGLQLLQLCRRAEIAVPDEVAVIGVDNDELLCSLSSPPLSSVIQDTYRIGFEAARMLDRWMRGKRPSGDLQIDPLGIAVRQSTDVLAIEDAHVAKAVRFIREHACDGIKIDDVMASVPISRRKLEHRFKKLLGHTPHEEILKLQFQRVRQLLAETSLPLVTIATRTGFKHVEYLSAAFKRRFGMPPSEYRTENRR